MVDATLFTKPIWLLKWSDTNQNKMDAAPSAVASQTASTMYRSRRAWPKRDSAEPQSNPLWGPGTRSIQVASQPRVGPWYRVDLVRFWSGSRIHSPEVNVALRCVLVYLT